MFSLLFGFWQLLFRQNEFQVLILGVDRAGKTTVLEQIKAVFTGREPLAAGKIAPTVGLNIGRLQVRRAKLIFWDLGGQSSLRAIWEKYYSEAHGLIYVVDAADPTRLEEARTVLCQLLSHPDLASIPLLVLANKQMLRQARKERTASEEAAALEADASGALTPHEVEARFALQQILDASQPRQVFGTAALTGEGVLESIHWLVETLRNSPRAQGIQPY